MNELILFNNPEFGNVRTLETDDGKVMFCGADIAKSLGYNNPHDAIIKHCKKDGVAICEVIDSMGRKQKAKFINEGNVYRLITHSKLPAAERFERWVFDEVLPTIRKHGAYMTEDTLAQAIANPDFAIGLLNALKQEQEKNRLLETTVAAKDQKIAELQPRADYTDRILQNKGLVTITQIAKDYGMSARAMNSMLSEYGVQYKQSGQWLLYSRYHDKGYTHSETINITRSDGRTDIKMETKWTQKGRLFIYARLKAHGILPVIERDDDDAET